MCIARFVSKVGKTQALEAALSKLLHPTRAEKGCISYKLYKDVENPRALTMVEIFQNQAAFEHHSNTSHLDAFKALAGDLIETVSLTQATTLSPTAIPEEERTTQPRL